MHVPEQALDGCAQVNLTCDHRIVYGAQAAEFLVTLKQVIENPEQLTL
jgi:pyruvate dehydrogenase E2 component (dihydrolipoamide acetyltransferase)